MMQDDVIPDDDTWQLLDAHQPSATVDKPFKKGTHDLCVCWNIGHVSTVSVITTRCFGN